MPPTSSLKIATGAVVRLVKEESSYHKELERQEARVTKLKQGSDDENAEYIMKQELRGIEETRAMFPQLRTKIEEALSNLERELTQTTSSDSEEDLKKAKQAVVDAKVALHESTSE